jgi:hypothetical protein
MPRLSLYRPEKGHDFRFLDRVINEQFQVGGTDVFVHKYVGPIDPLEGESSPAVPNNTNAIPELGIQDLIFMENRDRKYETDVYVMRGIYTMQDIDFNLSQFGLFLQNDTILIHFHLKDCVDKIQRKLMAGDVIELPHLKDEYALDDSLVALRRFYVIQDVTRPTIGFSQTWYPHLIRCKCVPLVDSQEFKQILDGDSGAGDGSSLRDLLSEYRKSIEINDQVIAQADLDAPLSGYDVSSYYVIPTTPDTGLVDVAEGSQTDMDASIEQAIQDASVVLHTARENIYVKAGYLTGDGLPTNGSTYGFGISFPTPAIQGQFFLRTDYLPNRLFRFDGSRWIKYEDNVRMTLNNFGNQDVEGGTFAGAAVRQTQKSSFINNNNTSTIAGEVVQERQALSKALKPRADN